ncbi:MAG: hypothetical protein PHX80_05630 [Candidatus Nanoarchaeia archaeon]|nr:hypothetical protein [Candidatus Nanoarchaeia archaeon]MDD5546764.1 hypothetical protein [Candidatus Omnitrophota bacterium]
MRKIINNKILTFCCERFKEFYNEGLIQYIYEHTHEIDETDWAIDGFAHLYYCPFCGAFIKGRGFGNYDKKYPPKRYTRIVKQNHREKKGKYKGS